MADVRNQSDCSTENPRSEIQDTLMYLVLCMVVMVWGFSDKNANDTNPTAELQMPNEIVQKEEVGIQLKIPKHEKGVNQTVQNSGVGHLSESTIRDFGNISNNMTAVIERERKNSNCNTTICSYEESFENASFATRWGLRNDAFSLVDGLLKMKNYKLIGEDIKMNTTESRTGNVPFEGKQSQKEYDKTPQTIKGRYVRYWFQGRLVPVARQWFCSTQDTQQSAPDCHCDTECLLFGDCCVDAFQTTFSFKDKHSLREAMKDPESLYQESDPYSLGACYLSLYHKYSNCHELYINDKAATIPMIDRCPQNLTEPVDPILQNKCSNISSCPLSSVPATMAFSKKWQVVFRNIYCALCHGLEKEDVVLWGAYAKCHHKFNLDKTNDTNENVFRLCTGVFNPPQNAGKLRACISDQDLVSECGIMKDRTDKDHLSCPVYIAPVNFNGKSYKNIHCAYCNKNYVSKFDKVEPIDEMKKEWNTHFSFSPPLLPSQIPTANPATTPVSGGSQIIRPPSMKVLFDFNFQAGFRYSIDGSSQSLKEKSCQGTSVWYDFISNSCRAVVCPFGREWINGACRYKELRLVALSDIYPKSETTLDEGHLSLSIISMAGNQRNLNKTVIFLSLFHKLNEIFTKYTEGNKNFNHSYDDSKTIYAIPATERIQSEISSEYHFNETFHAHLHILSEGNVTLKEIVECITKFARLIKRGNQHRHVKVQKLSLSNGNYKETYACSDKRHVRPLMHLSVDILNNTIYLIDRDINVAYHALYTRFALDFASGSSSPIVREALICSLLDCPQMKLSETEYVFTNGSVRLTASDDVISRSRYEIRNGTMYVCIPEKNNTRKLMRYKYLYSTQIIQKVTYSLSLTALGFTIIIYIKSSSVRTLHGKTLVSLAVSLIGAHITSLLETHVTGDFCKAVAIIMHFSWLAAFGWMSMISYDLLRTFFGQQTTVTNTHSDRKRYLLYSITGWLVPGAIVIACIILDNVEISKMLQPGYGSNGVCFIFGQKARLIFFQVPFLGSVLFNTVSFILTVYGISTKRKANPHSKRSRDRLYSLIYMKLSVVMGITWLFAILASATNEPVFWYLHLVLNGLQGVFVFISFALRASIWKNINIKKPRIAKMRIKESTFFSISGNSTSVK